MSRAIFALSSLLVLACGCGDADQTRARIDRDGALILEVSVDWAVSESERARGLRDYDALGDGEGLLILFPRVLNGICVVNDGVDFPIDAVFANGTGDVVAIERRVAAGDGTPRCHDNVLQVLEIAANAAAEVMLSDRLVVID